jgi:hypothetical protein
MVMLNPEDMEKMSKDELEKLDVSNNKEEGESDEQQSVG